MNRTELNQKMAQGNVVGLAVDGVDRMDYPDFCDAYFSEGSVYLGDGQWRDLSDTELECLTEDWGCKLSEMAHERCRDIVLSHAENLRD